MVIIHNKSSVGRDGKKSHRVVVGGGGALISRSWFGHGGNELPPVLGLLLCCRFESIFLACIPNSS